MSIPIEDFEDALLSACAKKIGADYIISRDDKFLQDHSPVKIVAPDDIIIRLTSDPSHS